MADTHDKATRSYNMSQIRSKNTKPEMAVRKFLFSKGFRFRLHDKMLPGKPDIILKKYNTAIFVHGCFWHAHTNCKYSVQVKSNTEYWLPKILNNVRRDNIAETELKNMGWNVLVLWECQLKPKTNDETLNLLYEDLMNQLK